MLEELETLEKRLLLYEGVICTRLESVGFVYFDKF